MDRKSNTTHTQHQQQKQLREKKRKRKRERESEKKKEENNQSNSIQFVIGRDLSTNKQKQRVSERSWDTNDTPAYEPNHERLLNKSVSLYVYR